MMFIHFNCCGATIIADILIETKKQCEGWPCKSIAIGIMVLGALLLVFGSLLKRPSVWLLSIFYLAQIAWCLFENYGLGYLFVLELPQSQKEYTESFLKFMNEHKLMVIAVLLVIAFIIASLSIAFIKSISPSVFIALIGLAYTEGCIYRIFIKIGTSNIYARGFVYTLINIVLLWLYIVFPPFILALMFAFLGSLMITCTLDTLYKFEWCILEAVCSSYQCLDANMDKEVKLAAYMVMLVLFALGLGAQIPMVLKLHEKEEERTQ
ncbi:hypothetical protein VCUG_01392 [Vavraia culicis subsp. floridensis]|uniref:Uncharacterized protein n=1 Tax=Vavraia culicis (isolate floridensis) TaxID=948595 RepID=L2GU16_VAVCU|nr:uncharacterized protein VCUG_01392 [Vavraia culicis subsp. floridensis]ELA47119.1 hypothetical protein VCUG_01392 [Vavraia culicis subsp. floridensis]